MHASHYVIEKLGLTLQQLEAENESLRARLNDAMAVIERLENKESANVEH